MHRALAFAAEDALLLSTRNDVVENVNRGFVGNGARCVFSKLTRSFFQSTLPYGPTSPHRMPRRFPPRYGSGMGPILLHPFSAIGELDHRYPHQSNFMVDSEADSGARNNDDLNLDTQRKDLRIVNLLPLPDCHHLKKVQDQLSLEQRQRSVSFGGTPSEFDPIGLRHER